MVDFKFRLQEIIDHFDVTRIQLATICRVDPSVITQYLHGKCRAKYELCKLLADRFNLDVEWVMGYDVPMVSPLNNLIRNYRKLNEVGQQKASEYIEDLADNDKYTVKLDLKKTA